MRSLGVETEAIRRETRSHRRIRYHKYFHLEKTQAIRGPTYPIFFNRDLLSMIRTPFSSFHLIEVGGAPVGFRINVSPLMVYFP